MASETSSPAGRQITLSGAAALIVAAGIFATAAPAVAQEEDGIDVGGAVRLQYSYEDYDEDNRARGGDLDLDTVLINFDGSIDDVILSAQLRYYQYMQVIHHAWVGYEFTEDLRGELGFTQVPFGNLPYNSHGFFFSSNYYLGLEDDYDGGLRFTWEEAPWDLRLAFYKNDEQGGVDGFVEEREDRYSYDVVAADLTEDGELSGEIAEGNTLVGRAAYTFGADTDIRTTVGLSALRGQLFDRDDSAGDYQALAAHLEGDYGRWNLQLQATEYGYELDSGNDDTLVVGAYSFFDRIPGEATTLTANLAYRQPVDLGPISAFTYYTDNSWVIDKPRDLEETVMNVLGVLMEAGPVFAYLDLISAKNQPFIGGSIAGDEDERKERINLNVGYYF